MDASKLKSCPGCWFTWHPELHDGHHQCETTLCEEIARLKADNKALADALSFYVAICGNTAWSVGRDIAAEMYDAGKEALAKHRQ